MNDLFASMLDSWNDPHARHAMVVHFPIALSVVGLALLALLAAFRFKPMSLRIAVVAVYAAAVIAALIAKDAGETAEDRVENSRPALTEQEHLALEEHEDLGSAGWAWLLAPAALSCGLFVPRKRLRVGAGVLALAAGVAAGGWAAVAGHTGGTLVYTHGLGVPVRGQGPATGPQPYPTLDGQQAGEHEDDDH